MSFLKFFTITWPISWFGTTSFACAGALITYFKSASVLLRCGRLVRRVGKLRRDLEAILALLHGGDGDVLEFLFRRDAFGLGILPLRGSE